MAEDDDGYVDRAQNRQLMRLFEQAALALEEGDRTVAVVLDGLDLDLAAAHGGSWVSESRQAHGRRAGEGAETKEAAQA